MSLFDDLHNPGLAEDAGAFFEEANAAPPDTSREAYRTIAPDLPRREGLVLLCLTRYVAEHKVAPTAYELFTSMAADGAARDLNDVRPRLTALHASGRVDARATRRCRITGRRAYTWAPKGWS